MQNEYSTGPDFYAERARKAGYPARSVYKLQEIDEKYKLLRRSSRVLDVGASPGSWSLYALKAGVRRLTSIDLKPLSPLLAGPSAAARETTDFLFLQGNLFDEAMLARIAERAPYDLIMSDAAPDTTGNRGVDTLRSAEIVRAVIDAAVRFLAPGGNLVTKLFQGGEEQDILRELRALFSSAKGFKPKASRKISFEVYVLGFGFRPAEDAGTS